MLQVKGRAPIVPVSLCHWVSVHCLIHDQCPINIAWIDDFRAEIQSHNILAGSPQLPHLNFNSGKTYHLEWSTSCCKSPQRGHTTDAELPKLTSRTLAKNDFNLHSFQREPSWNDVESEKLDFKSTQRFAVQKREQISWVLKHSIQLIKTQQEVTFKAETPKALWDHSSMATTRTA